MALMKITLMATLMTMITRTATLMTTMNAIMIQYSPTLSWHGLFVSGSVIYSFCNIDFEQNNDLLQLTLLQKSNYPSSQSLSNASYTTNCTLRVTLHQLMYHSAHVLFSWGQSHCLLLLLHPSMPQVTQVGFVAYVMSR